MLEWRFMNKDESSITALLPGPEPDLDSAQEGLGPPERQAELQDRFRGDVVIHARSMRDVPSDSLRTEAIRS